MTKKSKRTKPFSSTKIKAPSENQITQTTSTKIKALSENQLTKQISDIVLNLGITIVGVLLALQIQVIISDRATNTKLQIMFMESNHNIAVGKEIFNAYSDPRNAVFCLGKLRNSAVNAVLEDANLASRVPSSKIALISFYANALDNLEHVSEYYSPYLSNKDFFNTPEGIKTKELIRDNAAEFLAVCYMIRNKSANVVKLNKNDEKDIKTLDKEWKKAKTKVLKNKTLNDSFSI